MMDMKKWVGKESLAVEKIERWPLRGLASLLDRGDEGGVVDEANGIHPCAHWLYFVPLAAQSEIDVDGHPKRGGFLPPLAQPRRMWAKSSIIYHDDIHCEDQITKLSTIASLDSKSGKSGELIFLNIDNIYKRESKILREERQTIVYRDHQKYEDDIFSLRVSEKPDWSVPAKTGPVELFRYSAVTFNGHRIHYDSDYTRDVEGYPAIIVQGQFIATLLITEAFIQLGLKRCKRFEFKAVKPIFVNKKFFIEGLALENGLVKVWARQEDGRVNMTAEIEL